MLFGNADIFICPYVSTVLDEVNESRVSRSTPVRKNNNFITWPIFRAQIKDQVTVASIPDFMIACNQIHSQQILSSICRIMKHTTKALMMNRLIQSSRLITNVRERNAIYPDLKES